MDTNKSLEQIHPQGERELVKTGASSPAVFVDTYGGRVHVEWDPQADVTPLGQLPFFIDFLKTAELWKPWVNDCPPGVYEQQRAKDDQRVGHTVYVGAGGTQALRPHRLGSL